VGMFCSVRCYPLRF